MWLRKLWYCWVTYPEAVPWRRDIRWSLSVEGNKKMKYRLYRFITTGNDICTELNLERTKAKRTNKVCVFLEGKWHLKHCHFRKRVLFLYWGWQCSNHIHLRMGEDPDASGAGVSTPQSGSTGCLSWIVLPSELFCRFDKPHWKITSALHFLCMWRWCFISHLVIYHHFFSSRKLNIFSFCLQT